MLFAAFLVAALSAARPARRRGGLDAGVAAAALLPLVVWLIHGSIDWFWEMPALTGPALGFLGMTGALSRPEAVPPIRTASPSPARRTRTGVAGTVALLAATAVLAFPYLSVREISLASDIRGADPRQALADLQKAADLDPLSAAPGRLAGTIALQTGRYAVALDRFRQVTSRDPGGWYGWLGAGLAASAVGQRSLARHDFEVAGSIKHGDPVIGEALARVDSANPLSPTQALRMLVVV